MLKVNPFAAIPAPIHASDMGIRRETLARLTEGLGAREPFLLVTGEPGTGKTALVRDAIASWEPRATVAFVASPPPTRSELLEEIARRFGIEPSESASKPQMLASIERVVAEASERQRVAVIVIDDAHTLTSELLEELCLLVNATTQAGRTLEVVLCGLPALEASLTHPALASLRQRVGTHCLVKPLSNKETRRYLQDVVTSAGGHGPSFFPREACREVFSRTRGVPRAVNALAAEALRRAEAAKSKAITAEHVQAAAGTLWVGVATTGQASAAERTAEAARELAGTVAAAAESPRDARIDAPATPSDHAIDDSRVRDWVGRFIGEDEPRFGSLMGTRRTARGDDPWHDDAGVSAASGTGADEEPAGEEVVDATWSTRRRDVYATGHGAQRRRRHGIGTPVTVAAIVVMAAAVLVALPNGRRLIAGTGLFQAVAARANYPGAPVDSSQTAPDEVPAPISSKPAKDGATPAKSRTKPPAATPAQVSAARVSPEAVPSNDASAHSATPAAEEATAGPLALDVGTYINPERAEIERDRLATETSLQAWVVEGSDHGTATYRVILGIYSSPKRARASASMLLERGSVTQAVMIPLPPRSRRR